MIMGDLSAFENKAGWKVKQDPSDQLYEIRAENGRTFSVRYTSRRLAESALFMYLTAMTERNRYRAESNKAKK